LLDTLVLANQYAPVPSPLHAEAPPPSHADSALDFVLDEAALHGIRREAAETTRSIGDALLV
jgi:hypothetical protein